jgi:hypothetical protein
LLAGIHPNLGYVRIAHDPPATTGKPPILNAMIPIKAICELKELAIFSALAAAEEYE